MSFDRESVNTDYERRRVLQTMGAVTVPLIAGCSGDDSDGDDRDSDTLDGADPDSDDSGDDDLDSDDSARNVVLGLDCGGEHLNEAPVIDGVEFYPTSETRANIELENANTPLPEHAFWWDETVNFDPIPVAFNTNPNEGAQSDSLPAFAEIQDTEHDALYQTAYWADGELSIEFSLANGTYEVVVHLAETFFSNEQERVFDILINAQL